ncbi:MAG: hypothetical protein SOU05_06075 [Atopobium sp.]|uniref:hypothetical protein n=1 Tax=Atopobium sp. TaxID=1872650 RepID=UPI002A7537A4|nr:hypothetical protein [Atopobium sp.]MDY2788953.1 hypothetical protein [Atopobium sp.]MDY4522039.1 hypothetical protein [Atopobium sp.]
MKKAVQDQRFREEYARKLSYKRITIGIGVVLVLAWCLARYQFKGLPAQVLQMLVGTFFIAYSVNDIRFAFAQLDTLGKLKCILGIVLGVLVIGQAIFSVVVSV